MAPHVGRPPLPPPLDVLCLIALVLGPAPWCAAYAARQATEPAPRESALLALALSWCMVQMTIALVLGILGLFRLGPLMVAEGVAFLSGLPLMGDGGRPTLAGLASLPRTWIAGVLVLGIAVTGISFLLHAALTPTTDYDSLAYHLPVMARWYQTHAFVMLEQFSEGPVQLSRYPYGWEALSATFLMPLGDDLVVALPNLVAWLIFGLGIQVVAIRLGARPTSALAFALLALTTPLAREHVETMHVDLALGGFFMAGLALSLGSVERPVTRALFVATLGMLAGTKTSGLVYAAFLVPAFAWARRTERARCTARPRDRGDRLLVGAAVIAGALCGLFWYVRNLVQTGNPLGFVHVVAAGVTLFPGPLEQERIAATTLWRQFHITDAAHWGIVLGQAWKRIGPPFVCGLCGAFALRLLVARRTHVTRRDRRLVFVGLLVACALAYVTTPVSATEWNAGPLGPWMGQALRYAFPLIGLLSVAGALALSATRVPDEVVVPLVVAAGLVRASTWTMLPAAGLILLGWAVHRTTKGPERRVGRVMAACLVGALLFPVLQLLRTTRVAAQARVYRGLPGFLDAAVGPDETVGYLLSHQSYLFYGSHFDRAVVYVPVRGEDRVQWIASLRAQGIHLVALGPLRPEWHHRHELEWIEDPDGPFTPVFGHDPRIEAVIYRLDGRLPPGA